MRLWSIHPAYLDTQGLGGCWREALLAQNAIQETHHAYNHHPQLNRFRDPANTVWPLNLLGQYLHHLWIESQRRGFNYSYDLITSPPQRFRSQVLTVTTGQLHYEIKHLAAKLRERNHDYWSRQMQATWPDPIPHPLFQPVQNEALEPWEKEK